MSQIFGLGLISHFMTKKGNFCVFFYFFFKSPSFTSNGKITKPCITILRHYSLQIHLRNMQTIFWHISAIISEISMLKKDM